MKPQMKKCWSQVLGFIKLTFHWGYIPFIMYLGFLKGSENGDPITLASLVWQ
ncbi:mitochondrial import receptor subunit TOM7 homolog [Anabrus simplex]|uniref:mitochondrial import receptor subunit TOM7 homolog n=1 Tax=Anabrus simplex TaxID=316456 RepID=UPI0034DD982B